MPRKEQQNLTSHAMEAMKSSQKMTLENANAEFYQNVSSYKQYILYATTEETRFHNPMFHLLNIGVVKT